MRYPNTLKMPEHVTFNGVRFQRMGGKRNYYLSTATRNEDRKGAKGLHVAVWEAFHGQPFPRAKICHHVDGNPFNNHPSNLEPMSRREHLAHHGAHEPWPGRLEHLARARELTKVWHASAEGRAWHSANAKAAWAKKEKIELKCSYCAKKIVRWLARATNYCNSWCNFRALRDLGRFDQESVCVFCLKEFVCRPSNPKSYSQTCSFKCRAKFRVVEAGRAAQYRAKK